MASSSRQGAERAAIALALATGLFFLGADSAWANGGSFSGEALDIFNSFLVSEQTRTHATRRSLALNRPCARWAHSESKAFGQRFQAFASLDLVKAGIQLRWLGCVCATRHGALRTHPT